MHPPIILRGRDCLTRVLSYQKELAKLDYELKKDWDWIYHPSDQNPYVELYISNPALLTWAILKLSVL